MDPRLTLGLVSVFGAFAGAAFMFSTAPDTGPMPAPVAPLPVEELAAPPVDEPAAAAPATPFVPPQPAIPAAPAAPAVDPVLGLPIADDPWGAMPEAPAAAAPPIGIKPQPRTGTIPEGGPYPSDVRGIRQLFTDKDQQIKECMTQSGPAANPGEAAVMVRLHLKADPSSASGGAIERIEAVSDTQGRYQYFLTCLQQQLSAAPIQAPPAGTAMVHWSVRR